MSLATLPVFAEDWPSFSIVQLAIKADLIVSGKFLDKKDNVHRFLVYDFLNPGKHHDTLELEWLDTYYNTNDTGFKKLADFESSDELIIYLSRNGESGFEAVFSGFRILKGDMCYTPIQGMNPGKFSFVPIEDSISWIDLKSSIKSAWTKVVRVKELKAIQDPRQRNQALLDWTAKNVHAFGNDCELNDDCGWGSIEWDVFDWIADAGVDKDTWAASKLYRQSKQSYDQEDLTRLKIMDDRGGKSFRSSEGITFLMAVVTGEESIVEKVQALAFMHDAVDIFLYPIPSNQNEEVGIFNLAYQRELRYDLLIYLDTDSLKTHAFKVIAKLTKPNRFLLSQKDLVDMPYFIDKYHKEIPSVFKNDLAKFIVSNTAEEDWKVISGNDQQILVFLEYPIINVKDQELSFYVSQDHGKTKIGEDIIIILDHGDGTVVRIPNTDCKSSYAEMNGKIILDSSNLKSGKWNIHLEGSTGDLSQYSWRSEPALVVK